jgi:hypothetical protein
MQNKRPPTVEQEKALHAIRCALIDLVNDPEAKDPSELFTAIAEWKKVRQKMNDEENLCVIISFIPEMTTIPLVGNLKKDLGQVNRSAQENEIDRAFRKDPPSGKKN